MALFAGLNVLLVRTALRCHVVYSLVEWRDRQWIAVSFHLTPRLSVCSFTKTEKSGSTIATATLVAGEIAFRVSNVLKTSWHGGSTDGLRPGCTALGGRALIEKFRWYSTAVFREPPHQRLVQEDVHRCTVILIAAKAELGRQLLSFLNAGVHSDCFHEVYEPLSPIQLLSGLSCGLACRRIGDNWRTFGNLV